MIPYKPKKNISFIGRLAERQRIEKILAQNKASIITFYGRRRVGKTELIEQVFRERNLLKFEGIERQPAKYQINSFLAQLAEYTNDPLYSNLNIQTWREALVLLAKLTKRGKWTIYLEELQWLCDYDEQLVAELKFIWDNYFKHNDNIILILCGSSPSFMINKVVKSSSLYNRSLHEIPVEEFSLKETAEFFGKNYTTRDVFDAQLLVGGIPEYLQYLKQDSSILLSLCKESFIKGGFFSKEAEKIFVSSMAENSSYQRIIEYLSKKRSATRSEILSVLELSEGGNTSNLIYDLEICGFIHRYVPYSATEKSKTVRYSIADNYLQFYYHFILPNLKKIERGDFKSKPTKPLNSKNISIWQGFAFERLCRRYTAEIARVLGFSDVDYSAGVAFVRGGEITEKRGFQWDLLFQRKDRVYTLCEIKYTEAPISIDVIDDFIAREKKFLSKKNYRIQRVLISGAGASESLRKKMFFDQIIALEDLLVGKIAS